MKPCATQSLSAEHSKLVPLLTAPQLWFSLCHPHTRSTRPQTLPVALISRSTEGGRTIAGDPFPQSTRIMCRRPWKGRLGALTPRHSTCISRGTSQACLTHTMRQHSTSQTAAQNHQVWMQLLTAGASTSTSTSMMFG